MNSQRIANLITFLMLWSLILIAVFVLSENQSTISSNVDRRIESLDARIAALESKPFINSKYTDVYHIDGDNVVKVKEK